MAATLVSVVKRAEALGLGTDPNFEALVLEMIENYEFLLALEFLLSLAEGRGIAEALRGELTQAVENLSWRGESASIDRFLDGAPEV